MKLGKSIIFKPYHSCGIQHFNLGHDMHADKLLNDLCFEKNEMKICHSCFSKKKNIPIKSML